MADSTSKPGRGGSDFPLYLHGRGHWAKKIRGKTHYFGKDKDAALQLWLEQRDDLLAGRTVRPKGGNGPTLADACNSLLTERESRVNSGELTALSFSRYLRAAKEMTAHFGRDRLLSDLRYDDLVGFRAALAGGKGLVHLANLLRACRSIFRHANETGLAVPDVKYAKALALPDEGRLRAARQEMGDRSFSAEEVWRLAEAAGPQLRAMIFLAVNAGFGNTDCARLTFRHLDLDAGWHSFPRPKTANPRRCWFWPETCEAIKAAIAKRPAPKSDEFDKLVFITKRGSTFVDETTKPDGKVITKDGIAQEFAKLTKKLGIHRAGVGFYGLRRAFETVAGATTDQVAVDHIMGHIAPAADMSARYRQSIGDDRLKLVAEHVRQWYLAGKPSSKVSAKTAQKRRK